MCTRLYENGVPLEFIKKHMNHLDEEMTCHYIRAKELNDKKLQAINLIMDRVDSRGELLETDVSKIHNESLKKELEKTNIRKEYEAINKFLKKGKFKIMKDINEITNILILSNTPITETPEGYCAKSALVSMCKRQEYVSSLNDYYNVGVYIPSIEYIDITYKLFKDKIKIVKHNKEVSDKKSIYKLEYSRELKALKGFINKRFLPEINLLKEKIKDIGIDKSIGNYPNLKNIILKIDTIIDEEIEEWIQ